jgi:hypothetical protein
VGIPHPEAGVVRLIDGLFVPQNERLDLVLMTFPDELETLQTIIGGWIEGVSGSYWTAYVDEEGRNKGMAVNLRASLIARRIGWLGPVFVGPMLFLGPVDDEGRDTNVPNEVITEAQKMAFTIRKGQ